MRPPYLIYRPLRAGIAILNPAVDQYGTLGFFGEDAAGDPWLVSCYHVLGRIDFSPYMAGELIFQPDNPTVPAPVAAMASKRSHVGLDCAAAKILPGIGIANDVLGLGPINPQPALPRVGMRVLKYGVATELTEGVIADVTGSNVTIQPGAEFPAGYALSAIGDSGALWLEQGTMRPVALHKQGAMDGANTAVGSAIADVLVALGLRIAGG